VQDECLPLFMNARRRWGPDHSMLD
jgi:hypothetical protein